MSEDKKKATPSHKAIREPVTDSEGLPVTTMRDEPAEEKPTVNAAAREAYEAEVAADEEKKNREEWEKFLAR